MLKKIIDAFKETNCIDNSENELDKYNLKFIDNSEYNNKRDKLYSRLSEIDNLIKSLNTEYESIRKTLNETKDMSQEIGVDLPQFDISDLKIGDTVLFVGYSNGYGIFKGVYERYDGYASIKDINVVYHPNGSTWCPHRVDFKDIIKVVECTNV